MAINERAPLLSGQREGVSSSEFDTSDIGIAKEPVDGEAYRVGEDNVYGETYDSVPKEKRQIGLTSATFLIFNGIIGAGIYATPSSILRVTGSVGMSLVLWIVGSLIAASGTAVFVELGTGLPRSGACKNYLEYIYQQPKFLVTYIFAMFAMFIGSTAASAVVFGEYTIHAFGLPPSITNMRLVSVLALSVAFVTHATQVRAGLRIQNTLGMFMLLVLLCIALSGVFNILGVPGFRGGDGGKNLHWDNMWQGTSLRGSGLISGLYSVIWCYDGYKNVNYSLSEVKDPVRTLKRAAPLALGAITFLYLLVNIAFFVVVPKEEILTSRRVIVALFARHLFGEGAERVMSGIIALSVFGNVLAMLFTAGRMVQELGREGVLAYSAWFASNKPFGTPFGALFSQWLLCCITAAAPPPGDAFNFILRLSSYRWVIINLAIAAGVLVIENRNVARTMGCQWEWDPPFRAWQSAKAFFFLSNIFLAIFPLVPPAAGRSVYDHLPYWSHVVVCLLIGCIGALYWYIWCIHMPRRGGYRLVRDHVVQEDGVSRRAFVKVYDSG